MLIVAAFAGNANAAVLSTVAVRYEDRSFGANSCESDPIHLTFDSYCFPLPAGTRALTLRIRDDLQPNDIGGRLMILKANGDVAQFCATDPYGTTVCRDHDYGAFCNNRNVVGIQDDAVTARIDLSFPPLTFPCIGAPTSGRVTFTALN